MGKKLLLMEFGAYQVKIAIATFKSGTAKFSNAFLVDLPKDTYHDGKIIDPDTLKSRIKGALQENQINVKDTYLTTNGSHIITREIILPDVKDEEIEQMLRYEIEQYMPINMEQYVIEHRILERFKEGGAVMVRVLVATMSKKDVETYYNIIQEIGLKPMCMDVSGNALAKVFTSTTGVNGNAPVGSQTVALLDIGHRNIAVTIVENGIIRMNRLVDAGGSEITLLQTEEEFDQTIQTWANKIQRVFQFYLSRQTGNRIDVIYLFGGCADLRNLDVKLNEVFTRPVDIVKKLSNVQMTGKAKSGDLKRYLNLAGMIARNK